jgi:stage V sporulation protein B
VYQISAVIDGSLFGHIMEGKGLSTEARSALWGIYSNKYNLLINVPVSIASAMAVAIIPSIVASKINGTNLDVKIKIHQAIKFNMIIAIPAAVGMGVLASPILQLLFHDHRELPANLLRIGSVAIIFFALSTITNAVLQGINRMRIPVIHSVISLAVHIVLVFLLLYFFDLNTYALVIGNVTFSLLVCILNWKSVAKHLNYKQEIVKTFLIPITCSTVMGILTFSTYMGIYNLIGINSISTLAAVLVAVIVYFVLLLVLKGVTENDLYDMPLGRTIARFAIKLHLLK